MIKGTSISNRGKIDVSFGSDDSRNDNACESSKLLQNLMHYFK